MAKKILYVKRDQFLEWYLDCYVTDELLEDMLSEIKSYGKYKISDKNILNMANYIPVRLIVNQNKINVNDIKGGLIQNIFYQYILRYERRII